MEVDNHPSEESTLLYRPSNKDSVPTTRRAKIVEQIDFTLPQIIAALTSAQEKRHKWAEADAHDNRVAAIELSRYITSIQNKLGGSSVRHTLAERNIDFDALFVQFLVTVGENCGVDIYAQVMAGELDIDAIPQEEHDRYIAKMWQIYRECSE